MGYYSANKATIERIYYPRRIVARVYDPDTTDKTEEGWVTREFEWDQFDEALAWIGMRLKSLGM